MKPLRDYGIGPQITAAQATDVLQWAGEILAAAEKTLAGG